MTCDREAKFACKGCLLVQYCGSTCQKSHWRQHKNDCKSPYLKNSWMPRWHTQGRDPAFIGDGAPVVSFGGIKYFWGNTPALDVLRLKDNEGEAYGKDLHLLFAASGDIRNLAMTISCLPTVYRKTVNITLNDWDLDVVARNIIMLLTALAIDDAENALDCMLHVWYSAQLTKSHMGLLESTVRPLIQEVCTKISGKPDSTLLAKTWRFGNRSLRVVLPKSSWESVLSHLSIPEGLTSSKAQDIRVRVTLAEQRVDYLDRHLFSLPPASRMGMVKYRTDGILLPFGHPRSEFTVPNPTLFQNADAWPMPDSADPLEGWANPDVFATFNGPASKDLYGKLYYYVKGVLRSFCQRMSSLECNIQMFSIDAQELASHLQVSSFARIDVSNIVDGAYLGPSLAITKLAPLLQSRHDNVHATLIALYMNAAYEMEQLGKQNDLILLSLINQITQYMPINQDMLKQSHPMMSKLISAKPLFQDRDRLFDLYTKVHDFKGIERRSGTRMKSRNTIIEKWPIRLKLRRGQRGAQEEFDALMSCPHNPLNCYVEWVRVTE
ncbi:hypothetical protein M433DRAFT_116968 [Acidomyces richmondensis BFW]|nr:hypothetical protein M433DRAFT_116968 [Acidomyces richmondensis BFW]